MTIASIVRTIKPIIVLIVAIWAIELVNLLLGHRLNAWFGLEPRSLSGLIGVPFMPLLHGGVEHAAANTVPLAVLGALGALVAPSYFWRVTFAIVLISGMAVWLLARSGTVIGASGLVFGWAGFILALGALERSPRAILGAVIVLVFYGGLFWGILPERDRQISWEAHFLGAAAGAAMAYYYANRRKTR
ncbi:MAG: rhomboid family intramembrane serine protease [Pseudomonadota bacterium]